MKEGSIVNEYTIKYIHYNFLVKRSSDGDGDTPTMFFAEVAHDFKGEEDVYYCTPLKDTDSGNYIYLCMSDCFFSSVIHQQPIC